MKKKKVIVESISFQMWFGVHFWFFLHFGLSLKKIFEIDNLSPDKYYSIYRRKINWEILSYLGYLFVLWLKLTISVSISNGNERIDFRNVRSADVGARLPRANLDVPVPIIAWSPPGTVVGLGRIGSVGLLPAQDASGPHRSPAAVPWCQYLHLHARPTLPRRYRHTQQRHTGNHPPLPVKPAPVH